MNEAEQVSFRDYVDSRINSLQRATELAAMQMDKRLDTMNEFRAQLKDQQATFLPREEYKAGHDRMEEDVRKLQLNEAVVAGKASQWSVIAAFLVGAAGLISSIVSIVVYLHLRQ